MTANLTTGKGTAGVANGDTYVSIENLTGGDGNDSLTGDGKNNVLVGGLGNDILSGGAGNDRFNYTIGDGADTVDGGADVDQLVISGAVVAGVAANDTLTVVYNGTVLTGFEGGTIANVEAVRVNLGAGTDTLSYAGTAVAVSVDLKANTASGFTSIASIENVTGGSAGDTLIGSNGVNTIHGGGGADVITGGTGADLLFGDAGNDTFNYVIGDGADHVDGGADADTLTIVGAAGAVNETLSVVYTAGTTNALTAFQGGTIIAVESVTANLGAGTDTLNYTGTTANVTVNLATPAATGFTSIAGFENVSGGTGNDTFVFAADNIRNVINGGGGVNTADYSAYAANLTVNLGNNGGRVGGSGTGNNTDQLANIQDFIGGAGGDTIIGSGAANRLTGGAGNDTLTGRAGADVFIFNAGSNVDHITDFVLTAANASTHDIIDLTGGVTSFAGLQSHILLTGGHAVITLGTDVIHLDSITSQAQINQLAATDFQFH